MSNRLDYAAPRVDPSLRIPSFPPSQSASYGPSHECHGEGPGPVGSGSLPVHATKSVPALPPLWSEAYNAEGRVYYYNTVTKATQWTRPLQLMTLPPLWSPAYNAEGRVYYYNTVTKATQWTKPLELMTPAERASLTQTIATPKPSVSRSGASRRPRKQRYHYRAKREKALLNGEGHDLVPKLNHQPPVTSRDEVDLASVDAELTPPKPNDQPPVTFKDEDDLASVSCF